MWNILLLCILILNSLFKRRYHHHRNNTTKISYLSNTSTDSFERFPFEIVLIDSLLIIYQFLLTSEYHSSWGRSLNYNNANIYNIYPIEILKYQNKEDLDDYLQEGSAGVCSMTLDNTNKQLLNITNYVYNLGTRKATKSFGNLLLLQLI
ncbi:hypothetical protein I4U23_014376 [Adineta vaga]|nr:hypothetical protein I4U23_014376 [Adineta vaga]